MAQLLTTLAQALGGAPVLALAAALAWGVLSVLLSPCHLASIPLVVGCISQQGVVTTRRTLAVASVFALGMLVALGVLGAVTAAAGRMLGDVGPWGRYAATAMLLAVGLYLLDVIPLPSGISGLVPMRPHNLSGALVLGLLYGLALGPCAFAFLAPVLAVTFTLAATHLPYSLSLLLLYAIGHGSVLVLAGTFAGAVQHYLTWTERSRGPAVFKRICGALVAASGLYLLYTAP